MIYLQLNDHCVEVGTKLTGSCLWTPDATEGNKPLKLMIGWRTEGRGTVDQETLYETEVQPSVRSHFSCQIPVGGPVSYDGQLLRIIWEIVVNRPKWLGFKDTLHTEVFRVVPRNFS